MLLSNPFSSEFRLLAAVFFGRLYTVFQSHYPLPPDYSFRALVTFLTSFAFSFPACSFFGSFFFFREISPPWFSFPVFVSLPLLFSLLFEPSLLFFPLSIVGFVLDAFVRRWWRVFPPFSDAEVRKYEGGCLPLFLIFLPVLSLLSTSAATSSHLAFATCSSGDGFVRGERLFF